MSAFTSENLFDKLRIQIYQSNSTTNSQFSLLSKLDIPLNSIASREKYMMNLHSFKQKDDSSLNDSVYGDINMTSSRYSAFTHGNSLNEYYSSQSHTGSKKTCNLNLTNLKNQE